MKALLLTVALLTTACAAQDNIQWLSDYEQARKLSRESGKPLLVQFRCEA